MTATNRRILHQLLGNVYELRSVAKALEAPAPRGR